jgi:methyl-accepting chemotaxis protein
MDLTADSDITMQDVINANDEMGVMIASGKDTLSQFSSSADMMHMVCGQLAEAEEIAATSDGIALNCNVATERSKQGNGFALGGLPVVRELAASMTRIPESVKATHASLEILGDRSRQIGEIAGTLEDFADQAILFALNTAIGAAMASDQGAGFATVADDIRALAERTTRATKKLTQVTTEIQTELTGVVRSKD